jgi:glutamate racemase
MYSYVYLGDNANLPYGTKQETLIQSLTKRSVDHLLQEQDCAIVIIACNTASAVAVRQLQTIYLPTSFPDRRILSVLVPAVEAVAKSGYSHVGIVATPATVASAAFPREVALLTNSITISQVASPLLVPLIEYGGEAWLPEILASYLAQFPPQVEAVVLGCTHYIAIKEEVRRQTEKPVYSQDEVVPPSFLSYIKNHPELERRLDRQGNRSYYFTHPLPTPSFPAILTPEEIKQTHIISL